MLVLEDLIGKMKVHFPRWMDIRRKVKTSKGGQYLYAIGEQVEEVQEAITEYRKDFFLDKYIGKEDEVLTYLYKFHIGNTDISSIEVLEPRYVITDIEKDFHQNDGLAYYNDGFIYIKEDVKEIQYSIDGFKSVISQEKIHVWNIFDEFAVFLGLRRYQWESNKELLNRTLAFANNPANSSEDGLKNAILNNLINISNDITADDIIIERTTPENLNMYYDKFELVLDHLANVNRDVYRTKRWDLDTWNFDIKSVDYIPHAWDIVLQHYTNGIGFDDDLEVQIVDAEMKTDATLYFYKKTLEYINSYIRINNIKETIKLELVKHSDTLKPINVKYRITGTEIQDIDPDTMFIESYDYRTGLINQNINDVFDEEVDESQDIDIIDNSLLDLTENYYKIRFKSIDELKEMSIDKLQLYDIDNKTYRDLLVDKAGFERVAGGGIRSTLTKKYLSEKYHYSSVENAQKEIDGFTISNVELPTKLTANIDGCANEPIYYNYTCEEVPVPFQNINRYNCYVQNNSILSDTVSGEKYVTINKKFNSFTCKIHGPHKIIYSVNGGVPTTIERTIDNEVYDFNIGPYDMPQSMDIKIILNPKNNMQCAITDISYSKYEFSITTEEGELVEIAGQKRLPNYVYNKLYIEMVTYIGFSPTLEYVYIGTKLNNITYGDLLIQKKDGESDNCKIVMDKTNCVAELETYLGDKTEHVDLDYIAGKTIIGLSDDAYIALNLENFKSFKSINADRCTYESISYGTQVQHLLKIPMGVHLKTVSVIGEHEKLIFKESLSNILKRKGYLKAHYKFCIAKTNDNIIAIRNITEENDSAEISFLKIMRTDMISNYTAKLKISMNVNNIQTMFIEDSINKLSSIGNEYEGSFDHISFYPMSTKIYKAINECNVISAVTTVPEIINTFDNNYLSYKENSMFYLIESMNEEFEVKFNKNDILNDYSVDSCPINIIKKDSTKLDFDSDSVTVVYDSIIGNSMEIPDTFSVNKEKIETAKYIIQNSDLNIEYLDKHNDKLHYNDYVITEIVTLNTLMCNKLKYCNVTEIDDMYVLGSEDEKLEQDTHYKLFSKEGVVSWIAGQLINPSQKIFIKYSIKKPKFIILTLDELYEKAQYTVGAYELLNTVDLYEVNNNESYNLSIYEEYEQSSMINVKCTNIGFEPEVNGPVLTFKKTLKNNTVAVKAGYYYLDGDEYYLFADENKNNIEHIDNLYFFNVIKENKKLYFNQTTMNQVANSAFNTNTSGSIFNLNCQDKNIEGISKINAITTCENYNYWNSIGMNMSIVKGLNGSGIRFTTINYIDGYSYLNISKHIEADDTKYIISFYMNGDGEAYLGEERIMYSQSGEFNKQSIIEPKIKAIKSLIEDDMYEIEFLNSNSKNHYLIIKGNVTVDDIIVQTKESYSLDYHTKNISYLNLDIKENIYANYETRLYLDDVEGAMFEGTECKDGYISNSSYIDWGFTKSKELSSYEHFRKCTLEKLDVIRHNNTAYVKTGSDSGKLTTDSIYIGNVNTIRNLMFKINDVMFSNMKNFKVKVLSSENAATGFKEVSSHLDNIGAVSGDKLSSYIKLVVEMPPNKVINNIELFTEYLSDETNNPPEVPVLSGNYISKVLDAQYNTRFVIKKLGFDFGTVELNNVMFYIRASKENSDNTVWTDWKQIKLQKNEDGVYFIDGRIMFEGYRFFQFRTVLKGANASVKIKHLDLEVI